MTEKFSVYSSFLFTKSILRKQQILHIISVSVLCRHILMKGGITMNITTKSLFDLTKTITADYLSQFECPWESLAGLKNYIIQLGRTLDTEKFYSPSENVWIAKSATVSPSAEINPPCIIDEGAEIRHCAFIRGSAVVGKNTVVGNSTELKNVILFDSVQVPHFNYCGDSILGYKSHLGAGSVTSNVKSDKSNVTLKDGQDTLETGLRKLGAMVGDYVEVGCNSVLNPGTVVFPHTNIYPLSCVRGVIPGESIVKSGGVTVPKTKPNER